MAFSAPCSGELRHQVTVERPTDTPSTTGGVSRSWAELVKVWCKITRERAGEPVIEGRIRSEATEVFVCRYVQGTEIETTDRLDFLGTKYNIRSVENVEYRSKWLRIKAEKGVSD